MTWHLLPIVEFKKFSDVWDQLNSQNIDTALLNSNFVLPLLEYFAEDKSKLAIYGDINNPDAITVITRPKFAVWQTLQPSQSPLGLWVQNKSISTEKLLEELIKILPFPAFLIGLTQQDPELLVRPQHSACVHTLDYIQTARVSLNGSFDDYWAKRGKNLRQNLNRQRNRLKREGMTPVLKIITSIEDIPQAIIDYGGLESAGWKNEEGTAIHIENNQGKFYRDMLMNFCAQKNALVFQYYYGEQLVATDLCIKDESALIILKTTYDETITTSSPAMLMRQEAFEYIFTEHLVDRIEFYGKVMDWHTKWSDEIRTLYHVNYIVKPLRDLQNSLKRVELVTIAFKKRKNLLKMIK